MRDGICVGDTTTHLFWWNGSGSWTQQSSNQAVDGRYRSVVEEYHSPCFSLRPLGLYLQGAPASPFPISRYHCTHLVAMLIRSSIFYFWTLSTLVVLAHPLAALELDVQTSKTYLVRRADETDILSDPTSTSTSKPSAASGSKCRGKRCQ
jgi:hypothetical protein